MDQNGHREALDDRTLALLGPLALSTAAIFVVFIPYNLVDFPWEVARWVVPHDAGLALFTGLLAYSIRRRWVPAGRSNLALLLICVAAASNVLLTFKLLGEPFYTFYIAIILIGVGSAFLELCWALFTMSVVWVGWVAVMLTTPMNTVERGRFFFVLVAASLLAMALLVSRIREAERLEDLRRTEQRQRKRLEEALGEQQKLREHLDERVAQRTVQLGKTVRRLREQMDQREELAHQLRQAQRMEAIGHLSGGIAHDFNNVLTVVQGNLDIAVADLGTDAPGDLRELLEDASEAARRARDVTRQLLTFAKRQVVQRTVIDLAEAVRDDERVLSRLLHTASVLAVETPEDPVWVSADRAQLEQILVNLVVNARDALEGDGTIHLTVAEHGDLALLSVADDGRGMDTATRERAFDPFFTTKGHQRGTGLGLATVYGIVAQHEGRIDLESTVGEGTTVEIWLPLAAPPDEEEQRPISDEIVGGDETVLVVEDDDAVRRSAVRLASRLGYEVLEADGADRALQIARESEIDAVWTDVLMPGMDGRQLAEELRRLRPGIGVVYGSGYTADVLSLDTDGLPERTEFVAKPYTVGRVARALRAVLPDPGEQSSH